MLNFTVGPVMMDNEIKAIGAQEVPYFRTAEFSALMKENEKLILEMMRAPEGSRCVFLTGSGTAAMEASVINCFDQKDKVLVVNGGSFGQRFVELCELHQIPYKQIELQYGQALTGNHLLPFEGAGFTGFLVNMHETSTGVLYDTKLIGDFCKRNKLFLVVDCISSFLADPFDMESIGANVALTGSQKALAVPPGVSIVVLDQTAVSRVLAHKSGCMYLDLSEHLKNMERGQTPYTPAVSILIQIHTRLKRLEQQGGVVVENHRTQQLANDFREKIRSFDFRLLSESPSNAVTALGVPDRISAYRIFEVLKDEYDIFVCPNGGELKEKVFRVGHIGHLSFADNDKLIAALEDLKRRSII